MVKIHKYYINPEHVCGVYKDKDVIKIDMVSGNVYQLRDLIVDIDDVIELINPSKVKRTATTKKD